MWEVFSLPCRATRKKVREETRLYTIYTSKPIRRSKNTLRKARIRWSIPLPFLATIPFSRDIRYYLYEYKAIHKSWSIEKRNLRTNSSTIIDIYHVILCGRYPLVAWLSYTMLKRLDRFRRLILCYGKASCHHYVISHGFVYTSFTRCVIAPRT